MKTEIENLLAIYPELEYEDGFLYPNKDDDGYISKEADSLIAEFFEGREIPENPNEYDPEKMNYIPVSGLEYIKYRFNNDFNLALQEI